MLIKNLVLLLKTATEDATDKYVDIFTKNDFKVRLVKTLDFKFRNLNVLSVLLKNPDDFSGLIFSSPRCVEAVHKSLCNERIKEEWRNNSNYVVGEKTYDYVLEKLGLVCKGKETGNASNLAKEIILDVDLLNGKPLLFPHGNLKTGTLEKDLGQKKIGIYNIEVYDTITNLDIEKELIKATENYTKAPEYVVLFSPSGLKSSIEFLRKIPEFLDIKYVAVGPVTEAEILKTEIKLCKTALKPNPEEILKAVESYTL
ncbi:unnamed protein product [Brassicogethes aeneus]|uniref:Uroporphyrinogen-III synthase n=1 Tax=Brassicogethes aeneus TaxID=1431903 RepID=A0A9P0B6C4_BRAAE|nr:unnamed protein product [Brassicogethes aeneus]